MTARTTRRLFTTALLALAVSAPLHAASPAAAANAGVTRCDRSIGSQLWQRTELYFGLSRPGGVVSEEEFKNFVDVSVTPRFPDGLTLLSGVGQFRDASGAIIVEGSKLLILLYPRDDRGASERIEAIRTDYKARFEQQSVLRTDGASCVSF